MPISIVFFLSFPTWGFHFILSKSSTWQGNPLGRNVVCFSPPLRSSPYNNNPPCLCFLFIGKWYAYGRFCIKCGPYFFTIVKGIFNIGVFNATNEVCNLASIGVGPFYITSSWLFYFQHKFSYFGQIGGIWIIHWIICGQGSSWGSWDNILSPYAYKSLGSFCDALVVLCLMP